MSIVDLRQLVRVNGRGRTVPLGDCGPTQLAAAIAVAGRECRTMERNAAATPARVYNQRAAELGLYSEISTELAQARLPRVKLLSEVALARAARRAGREQEVG
jgi:hypothetical protein